MFDLFPAAKKVLAILAVFLSCHFYLINISFAQDAASPEIPTDEAIIEQGRSIFTAECQVCHQVHQRVVGPALADVTERRPIPWLIAFIHNSQQVIQSGDEYAVELFNEYNRTPMPAFSFLTDEEILSVLAYINKESEAAPVAQEQAPAEGEAQAPATGIPTGYVNVILIGILVVLVLILIVLGMIISTLSKYLTQREGVEEGEKPSDREKGGFKKFISSTPVIGILVFVFVAISVKAVIDQLYLVGVQQGYAPEQPIWFSHQIHAGTYQIDCQYCHTSASVSKNAGIPSVGVCMNCHNPERGGIVTGTQTGEVEIQKVIDSYQNNVPIMWVRIHNLPDLAYFNHSQHVTVGGVECQTCHGLIEEMDVVRQHASLTMGWCIDCHRTTPLNTEGNDYYDQLVEMHEQVGEGALLVQDIGATECSKCHY